ncbi:hypothetical protein Dimus_033803 [Dionaea muscipula]
MGSTFMFGIVFSGYWFQKDVVEIPYTLASSFVFVIISVCNDWTRMDRFQVLRRTISFSLLSFFYFIYYGMMVTSMTPNQELSAILSSLIYSMWNLFAGFAIPRTMRSVVSEVANNFPTAIISGRSCNKVHEFVKLNSVYYAGSHGMDIMAPPRNQRSSDSSKYQTRTLDKNASVRGRNLWYLDSCFSRYMTGSKSNFLSLTTYHGGSVTFGDDNKGEIIGIGKIGKSLTHSIDNVYHMKGHET